MALLNGGVTGPQSATASYCSFRSVQSQVPGSAQPASNYEYIHMYIPVERAGIRLLHVWFPLVQEDAYYLRAETGHDWPSGTLLLTIVQGC